MAIVPISNEKHIDFAEAVYKKMRAVGIRVKLDDRSESMNYKIRESLQDKKIPYVCVIGDKEIEAKCSRCKKTRCWSSWNYQRRRVCRKYFKRNKR